MEAIVVGMSSGYGFKGVVSKREKSKKLVGLLEEFNSVKEMSFDVNLIGLCAIEKNNLGRLIKWMNLLKITAKAMKN